MRLSEREQRILADLDHDLTVTDPELADLFARSSVEPWTVTDPRVADLFARLFVKTRRRRHHRLMRGLARRFRFRAR